MSTLRPVRLTRRSFLEAMNVGAGGLALGFFAPPTNEPNRGAPEKPATSSPAEEKRSRGLNPNVFVHVAADGLVTIASHRSEMGQGVRSTLPVLIADELGADMARVRVVQVEGDKKYGNQNTDGSTSVRSLHLDLRRAGATARVMLVQAAARRWKVPPEACVAEGHAVLHRDSGRSLPFGALAEEAGRLRVPAPAAVPLRPLAELKNVGGPLPLRDAPDYVTGKAVFGADVRLPGMLTAVVVRPPVVGSRVAGFDPSRALAVPGVKRVLELPAPSKPYVFQPWGGVAVLAENTWAAMRGAAALEVRWTPSEENGAYDSDAFRQALSASVAAPGAVARKVGDVEAALASAARVVEAEYHVPHLPHAPMEPPVAVARFEDGACEVWASTQNPQAARDTLVKLLGLPEEKVRVNVTFLGGGFGRKSKADFVAEAALLAREAGVPVRVQWTRADDVRHDYYHSVSTNRLTAGLDAAGKVTAWRLRTAFTSIGSLFDAANQGPGDGDLGQGVKDLPLAVPNVSAETCKAKAHVRIGWLRSVYNIFQAFSTGSFMDELAHARGLDTRDVLLELHGPPRLATLEEIGVQKNGNYGAPLAEHPVDVARLRGVIERVTAAARWGERARDGRALGLAAHRSFLSYTGVVASVVRTPQGRIAVDEVWICLDAGQVLNPDRVASQLEGAVIFGMSLALYGGITMKGGATEQSSFRDVRLVRMGEAPRRIHVEVVKSDKAPGGVGEPGVPPVAPAIANAVFALTGTRVRELPLVRSVKV